MAVPNDPVILLSYINTQLRDKYCSLDDLCDDLKLDRKQLENKLKSVDYEYDDTLNKFI